MKTLIRKIFCAGVLLLVLGAPATAQFIRPVVGEDTEYVAQEGDTLLKIATKHGLAIDHLAFANGYPITAVNIVPGSVLTIPGRRVLPADPPHTGLVLNIPERGLYRFQDGKFVDFLPASVGQPPKYPTPVGQWHIIEKVVDPWWYPPSWAKDRKPVPPGPQNPLGDRWIGLSATRVGIHGTDDDDDVGAEVTHGCIRLYPKEVRMLYNQVSVGMPVRIEYEVAKLGRDPKTGHVMIVNFPDIYKRVNPVGRSSELLKKLGKPSLSKDRRFVSKLGLTLGTMLDTGVPATAQMMRMR